MYYPFKEVQIKKILKLYKDKPFVFLETAIFDKNNRYSFLFSNFEQIISFYSKDNVKDFFKKIEDFLAKGFWLAGYLTYEFGFFLDDKFKLQQKDYNFPLAWFGICRNPIIFDHSYNNHSFGNSARLNCNIYNQRTNLNYKQYFDSIEKIKQFLEEGLTYQVNYTFKIKFDFEGFVSDLYLALRRNQTTSYMAFINTGSNFILSFSPELFFRITSDYIVTAPMKGTVQKGLGWDDDKKKKRWLANNKKIRAENVMIVDLLRNDLGRICKKVWVEKLFNVESYRTVNQLTSTICGKLKDNLSLYDIFYALFPSGSVTGAPKIKTMQIISSLEKEPRKVYTGAIGYISYNRSCCFNVAIRTILLDKNKAELGVGGGIVYDSIAEAEFCEANLKSKFLNIELNQFYLIESILWDKEFVFLNLHIRRLIKSCKYFSIYLDLKQLKKELKNLHLVLRNETKDCNKKFKIRILVNLEGSFKIEKEPLEAIDIPVKIKLSNQKIDPNDIFLYHKTTKRSLYDEELEKARREGFFDVIFTNKESQITEGAITNIFVKKGSCLYTPPVNCGLLAGILREYLLKTLNAKEKILYIDDLLTADKIYVGNSVRGLLEAKLYTDNNIKLQKYEEAIIS